MTEITEKQAAAEFRRTITGEAPNIYMERSGKGSRRLSEALLESPEDPLNPEEADEALAYEGEICNTQLSTDLTLETLLRKHKGEAMWAPKFFAEAFLTSHVHIPGLEGVMRQHKTSEDVYAWLAQAAADESIDATTLTEMARQSSVYYKTEMQQALVRGERPGEQLMSAMPIVLEPTKTLHFAEAGIHAKEYLNKQRLSLRNKVHGVEGAKKAFIDIYSKRINAVVASDIVVLEYLIAQSKLIYDEETVVDAYNAMPSMLSRIVKDDTLRPSLNKRLDYIKNGIGYDESGAPTAVDEALFESGVQAEAVEKQPPIFTPEQKQILRDTPLSADAIYSIFEDILREGTMLSSEDASTWTVGRGKRAEDNLFQVVHHPEKDTLAVNGIDGVIMTPNNARSLYDVLTVGAHELTHINQAQADQTLGRYVRIGALKGRRVSMLRETGANVVQRKLEEELFGESKPVAFAYAKSIRTLEAGGDVYDATKAFYDEKITAGQNVGAVAAAGEAADRVLRLMLSEGTNSQPLSYAEENIMHGELAEASPEVRQRATMITTLDLDDQLRLHRYGLLPTPDEAGVDWTPILLKRLEPLIQQALNQSNE